MGDDSDIWNLQIPETDRHSFGYNISKSKIRGNAAWIDPCVTGGTMMQEMNEYKIASRETSGCFRAAWASKAGSLIAMYYRRDAKPIRGMWMFEAWLATGDGSSPAIPSGLAGIRPVPYKPNLVEGERRYVTFLSKMWYLWARNVTIETEGDGEDAPQAFNFDNADVRWFKAEEGGAGDVLTSPPEKRPFKYPEGNEKNKSYLSEFTTDLPPSTHWKLGDRSHCGLDTYIVPSGVVNSRFFDEKTGRMVDRSGDFHKLGDDDVFAYDQWSVPRHAGSFIDWSTYPAVEKYLFWHPFSGSPGGGGGGGVSPPDLTIPGLPQRIDGGSIPPGTAFDMTCTCCVYEYVILSAYKNFYRQDRPDVFVWLATQDEPRYFNTTVSLDAYQIVPVAPKG